MNINLLGFGVMAKQIGSLLYLCGFDVTIWNHRPVVVTELDRQIKLLARQLRLEQVQQGSLHTVDTLTSLKDAVTIEAVTENLAIKRQLYAALQDRITKAYFTNSSSFSPQEIGSCAGAMHFFNPIHLRLIEFTPTPTPVESDTETLLSALRAFCFEIVQVKTNRGYIGNFLLFQEISNALKLIEKHGYSVEAVRAVASKLYGERDIFAIIDLVGVDVTHHIITNLAETDPSIYQPALLKKALTAGILGRKNKTSIADILASP